MPGLVPGIHVLGVAKQGVDGRDKPGHDVVERANPRRSRAPLERSSLPVRQTFIRHSDAPG